MPGIEFSEEDRKKIDPKYICCCCNLLLKEPMQTVCGHLICFSCLELLMGSSNPICPEDGTELKKEQVFPDAFTKRQLKQISIHCSNQPCTWCGSYDSVEEHVETSCQFAPVKCKYCQLKILRKDMKEHEEVTCGEFPGACEFQAVGCNHHKVLKRKELQQHFNDGLIYHVQLLLGFVLNLVSQLKDYIPRGEFQSLVHTLCEEVRVTVTEKLGTFLKRITGLEKRVESLESAGGVDSQMKNEIQDLKNKFSELNAEVVRMREINATLERDLREKTSEIDCLRCRLVQIDESLALNTVKITDLESARGQAQVIHSDNGTLLWKIEGFQRKRQDAISGVKTALYSPHFYSSQFGYKMCAKIYMNGDGFGKGSHLSLFFVVMKGDYDALQSWPFQKKITMMLLDQGYGDHVINAFHSDPQSSSFQRPRSDMNIASGSPLFMPLDSLNNRQYIEDDTIFIKIIVGDYEVDPLD